MTEELKPVDDAVLAAAYAHVDSVVRNAAGTDHAGGFIWHGWAVREAFIAGVKWQQEQAADQLRAAIEQERERSAGLLHALEDLRMRYETLFKLYAVHSYSGDASSDLRLALTTADLAIASAIRSGVKP